MEINVEKPAPTQAEIKVERERLEQKIIEAELEKKLIKPKCLILSTLLFLVSTCLVATAGLVGLISATETITTISFAFGILFGLAIAIGSISGAFLACIAISGPIAVFIILSIALDFTLSTGALASLTALVFSCGAIFTGVVIGCIMCSMLSKKYFRKEELQKQRELLDDILLENEPDELCLNIETWLEDPVLQVYQDGIIRMGRLLIRAEINAMRYWIDTRKQCQVNDKIKNAYIRIYSLSDTHAKVINQDKG